MIYYTHFEMTGDPNLIGSQQCDLFTNVLNRVIHVLNLFCFKSHLFRSVSHHFCFECKMRCKSLFVSAFQQTSYLISKLLEPTEFCDFKMAT